MAFTGTFLILVGGGTWAGHWLGEVLSRHTHFPDWLQCRLAGIGGVLGFFTGLALLGKVIIWMSEF